MKIKMLVAQNPTASHPCAVCIETEVFLVVAFDKGVIMKTNNKMPGML